MLPPLFQESCTFIYCHLLRTFLHRYTLFIIISDSDIDIFNMVTLQSLCFCSFRQATFQNGETTSSDNNFFKLQLVFVFF